MIEIRGHARGGQGMVTAFEILAKIFSHKGKYHVQAFPAFGVERTGAPIQAFLRVSKEPILNRSNVYHPHLILVFDEALIEQVPVFDGLRSEGSVLFNTERKPEDFSGKADKIYTIEATKISLEKGLGSKSLPIVNAAMIGAIVKILDTNLEIAKDIVGENVPAKPGKNMEAAEAAYGNVIGFDGTNDFLLNSMNKIGGEKVELKHTEKKTTESKTKVNLDELPRMPYWNQPMSLNKTGNWRVLTPSYVTRNAPCTNNCPAGTDVRLFVKLTGEKNYAEAYNAIYEHNPFPSTCGRVCPHFCEQNCNRNDLDGGLNIGSIERFLGDYGFKQKAKNYDVTQSEKIAVVGAGPAGLTAALRLVEKGYDTTVFEALPYAGGMMRTGIPEFRLPQDILDQEIKRIEDHGVKIILNKKVTVNELEQDFDGVVVSVGSHVGSKMNIRNEEHILDGIVFLQNFKLQHNNQNISNGDEIAIIGGGNTAIDVARTSLRLGAKPTIFYRRTRKQMPAIAHEVDEALAEGVEIKFLTAPVALNKNGKIKLQLIEMKLGEPDESGRRRPIPIEGSEYTIETDHVIAAIGQKADEHVFAGEKVKAIQGKIDYSSTIPVFCAGDMAWGGTVTEAIGSGNKVAEEVFAYLNNQHYTHEDVRGDIVVPTDLNFAYYLPTPRTQNPVKKSKDFYNDFDEVIKGLTETEVLIESQRCLHCGECFSCGNCYNYCPDAAIHIDENNRLRIDYDYCKGCGICAQECPASAINFQMNEVVYE